MSFNHAADIRVEEKASADLIGRVTDLFSLRNFPFACFRVTPLTRPASLATILEAQGFKSWLEMSAMWLGGVEIPHQAPSSIRVEEVAVEEIDAFVELMFAIFSMPAEWKPGFSRLFQNRTKRGGKLFLARVKGAPAGICGLLSAQDIGLLYSVGTLEMFRGMGVGTALTRHAVEISRSLGNDFHTLQAERGGYAEQFYTKLGFEIDHHFSFMGRRL